MKNGRKRVSKNKIILSLVMGKGTEVPIEGLLRTALEPRREGEGQNAISAKNRKLQKTIFGWWGLNGECNVYTRASRRD